MGCCPCGTKNPCCNLPIPTTLHLTSARYGMAVLHLILATGAYQGTDNFGGCYELDCLGTNCQSFQLSYCCSGGCNNCGVNGQEDAWNNQAPSACQCSPFSLTFAAANWIAFFPPRTPCRNPGLVTITT